jgi:phosphoenolpyruvate carboxylase
MPKIPRCMNTQHPDNVHMPFFVEEGIIDKEHEVIEAYYAFSHLGCDEQMWDCEGKETDNYVVKKLLMKYESFFKEKILGKDIFLTLRVPNPTVEQAEAKILLETLESMPRSYDAAKLFYEKDIPPIFEVILPMATTCKSLERIYHYYKNFVVGKQNMPFKKGDITIKQWIGEFKPESINVIPLFEDAERMLNPQKIVREYLKDKNFKHQRVFIARSDPAMNYGVVSAVLLNKIALFKLQKLEKEIGIDIYPIIGVGSVPFRGNLKPSTVLRVLQEYPSVQTFTVQSAFKYDNPVEEVIEAIEKIKKHRVGQTMKVVEKRALDIIKRYTGEYQAIIKEMAPLINEVAKYVPSRRERKLHIGLFGYAREMKGISLPRAIQFTAALYSIGLPPEIFGLGSLKDEDVDFIKEVYIYFEEDLQDALHYLNENSLKLLPPKIRNNIKSFLKRHGFAIDPDPEYKKLTDNIRDLIESRSQQNIQEMVINAAHRRRFLG